MYKITISNDTADSLMRDMLIQDFRRVKAEIRELESKLDNKLNSETENLDACEAEDLIFNINVRDALKVLLEYYLPLSEAYEIINEDNN